MGLIKLAVKIPRSRSVEASDAFRSMAYGGYLTEIGDSGPEIKTINPRHRIVRTVMPGYGLFDNSKDIQAVHRLGLRHEVQEAKYGMKNRNDFKHKLKQFAIEPEDHIIRGKIHLNNNLVGLHTNLAVLGHESNDVFKLTNNKIKNRHQKIRYLSGESQILKEITGKKYGIDQFDVNDIKKLEQASYKQPEFFRKRKRGIGALIGAATAPLLVRNKNNDEDIGIKRLAASVGGAIAGNALEPFVRTNILRLHKRI